MTVGQLEASMPLSEFIEWEAYAEIEPFGFVESQKQDWRFALLAANIVNTLRGLLAKKARTIQVKDFLPEWRGESRDDGKRDTKEVMQAKVMALRSIFGSKKKKSK